MNPPAIDLSRLDAIIDKHKNRQWGLIPLLQEVQETYGYVPPETIEPIRCRAEPVSVPGPGGHHFLCRILAEAQRQIRLQGMPRDRLSC